ncbi:MAG: CRISPR-associated endonuclease Cas1 [Propioniciclava sp.]|uniref:CRISPR-associated endonuclease Cas1 n=1 Tax=Propioniciclava sp. TaxID=2038686 RepID=UPI0039E621B0
MTSRSDTKLRAEPGPDDDSLPISLVAHYAFCPRRAWLESVGERQEASFAIAVGDSVHARVEEDSSSTSTMLRGMTVWSHRHGYHGRLDAAEVLPDHSLNIIEYKATPIKARSEITQPMRHQLALQWRALEEMGNSVSSATVFFATQKRRVPVELNVEDFESALADVAATRAVIDSTAAPPPLEDSPQCARCSHVSICLPDEREPSRPSRRISVVNPDAQVLHLATYGALASIRDGRIRVRKSGEEISSIPIERVHAVAIHGNVDLSSGLLRELLWRRIPVTWCTSSGRIVGWASSAYSPNGNARVQQHVASSDGRLDLAREFVTAKIHNQATQLRRHGDRADHVLAMRRLVSDASNAASVAALFGTEGVAARLYFSGMPTMLASRGRLFAQGFPGRVKRGATDRLNVCLNYTYGLLVGDCIRGLLACGLDPHAGFLHSSNRNKPALALDLAEEFRAPVGDSVVLGAINNGEIDADGFWDVAGSMRLKDPTRKALIRAYERRIATEFKHPIFGYRVTWRRAIEIQARMILGVLDGSQKSYVGIRVR